MANVYVLSDVPSLSNRTIFFDANVLIYLFGNARKKNFSDKYSTIYKQILKQRISCSTDYIIISEFINTELRISHRSYLNFHSIESKKLPYKNYRDSADGKEAISDVYTIVRASILKNFMISGKNFTKNHIDDFLHLDTLDFSDKAIRLICKENRFVLCTNDGDFRDSDIDILTINNTIIQNNNVNQ